MFPSAASSSFYSVFLRLTSGTDATADADFTGEGSLTLKVFVDFVNDAGTILDSSTMRNVTVRTSNISGATIVDGGVRLGIGSSLYTELNTDLGFRVPDDATQVNYRVESVTTSGTLNWGITTFEVDFVPSVTIPKPDNTAAYITSDTFNNYALIVQGGLGLRVPPVLFFEGSSTAITQSSGSSYSSSGSDHIIYEFVISYTLTTGTAPDVTVTERQSTLIVSLPPLSELDTDPATNRIFLGEVREQGALACTLLLENSAAVSANPFNRFALDLRGSNTVFSNAAIRRIWRRMR